MERKIGEIFEFEGKKLKVVETEKNLCFDCYFYNGVTCQKTFRECGKCEKGARSDYKPIIFVEVKDEQPQELNLCEVLKDCPKGTKLYSPMFGEVDFERIQSDDENAIVITKGYVTASFTKEGFYYAYADVECTLFPSKDQRDWSKFAAPWLKKERFNPKTLKAFDKVVVRGTKISEWICGLFSHIIKSDNYDFYICIGSGDYKYCIPYNDNTKHLVGTIDEAPDFYRYWED